MTPYRRIIKAPPSTDIEVWIDPRTKEPCRRCDGTGKMQPWPGSKGLVVCGVCRAEIRPLPNPLSPQEEQFEHPIDELAQRVIDANPPTSLSAAYRQVAKDQYVAAIQAENNAGIWRNRAIAAEEEIREGGRGIDLRKDFEQ